LRAKATIQDIARALNVTASTVSRALNDHPGISSATKKAVSEKAVQLHYKHNRIAAALRLGRSKIIGVIVPSTKTNFFGSVLAGIEKVANENGYSVIICQSNELFEHEQIGIDTLLHAKVDGILASVAKETESYRHYQEVRQRNVPLILFDRVSDCLSVPSVAIDDYGGAYMATEHLIRQGCTTIAHIAGPAHIKIFIERLKGYTDALKAAGLPVRSRLIKYGKIDIESGRACMKVLMSGKTVPDGLLAAEDFTAMGAMEFLKENGWQIPGDVAVVGFANEAFGAFVTPSLSTIDQRTVEMGEKAALLFLEGISKKEGFYKKNKKNCIGALPYLQGIFLTQLNIIRKTMA